MCFDGGRTVATHIQGPRLTRLAERKKGEIEKRREKKERRFRGRRPHDRSSLSPLNGRIKRRRRGAGGSDGGSRGVGRSSHAGCIRGTRRRREIEGREDAGLFGDELTQLLHLRRLEPGAERRVEVAKREGSDLVHRQVLHAIDESCQRHCWRRFGTRPRRPGLELSQRRRRLVYEGGRRHGVLTLLLGGLQRADLRYRVGELELLLEPLDAGGVVSDTTGGVHLADCVELAPGQLNFRPYLQPRWHREPEAGTAPPATMMASRVERRGGRPPA